MPYLIRNKWSVARKTKIADRTYDSRFEGKIAQDYIFEKAAGKIKDVKMQIPLDLICNNFKVGAYVIDFVVYKNDGTVELVEAKGIPSEAWKLKWKILESMVESKHEYLIDKYGKGTEITMLLIKQKSNWNMRGIKPWTTKTCNRFN